MANSVDPDQTAPIGLTRLKIEKLPFWAKFKAFVDQFF